MTKIDFFSNAPNRLEYVVRLLKKIQSTQQKAVVYGEQETINHLSAQLWQANGFCAHDVYHSDTSEQLSAPIYLTSNAAIPLPHYEVLVNLSDTIPAFFASFHRLIEIVPHAEKARQHARDRWSHYKSRGYKLNHHEITQKLNARN